MSWTKRNATYQDIRDAPEDRIAELFEGDLYLSPRPRIRHSNVISLVGATLVGEFHLGRPGRDGWWILDEPEVHLADDVFVPDIVGWRRSTLPALPDVAAIEIVPDWVCEVLSPATAELDRGRKLPLYHRYGVGYAWLIDPELRTLEALVRERDAWRQAGAWTGAVAVRAVPFEAVEIDLAAIWL